MIAPEDEEIVRSIERLLGSKIERRMVEGFDYNKPVPVHTNRPGIPGQGRYKRPGQSSEKRGRSPTKRYPQRKPTRSSDDKPGPSKKRFPQRKSTKPSEEKSGPSNKSYPQRKSTMPFEGKPESPKKRYSQRKPTNSTEKKPGSSYKNKTGTSKPQSGRHQGKKDYRNLKRGGGQRRPSQGNQTARSNSTGQKRQPKHNNR